MYSKCEDGNISGTFEQALENKVLAAVGEIVPLRNLEFLVSLPFQPQKKEQTYTKGKKKYLEQHCGWLLVWSPLLWRKGYFFYNHQPMHHTNQLQKVQCFQMQTDGTLIQGWKA